MTGKPYKWTATGLPWYRSGGAPPFLKTAAQISELGLKPDGPVRACVDSQYDSVGLFLLTETKLADPDGWPPAGA